MVDIDFERDVELPSPYNTIRAIPSSFFIDSEGKIKLGSTGLVSLAEIKAIFEAE